MQKGIFIGLGGAGITTVARLKALLFQRAYSSDKTAMDADCSFIFYDTDKMSIRNAQSDAELQRMMGGYPVIDLGNEFIDAGAVSPYQMYQMAKYSSESDEVSQRVLEWAIDPNVEGHFCFPQKKLDEGAGADRMVGRTGFVFKMREFEEKIRSGLSKFRELLFAEGGNLEVEHPSIWVFSSSNGGTSSSALLDVLYLIDRLYKTEIANVDPDLRLVLYMPKAFMDLNQGDMYNTYALNAYSTLWELNAFRADAVLDNDGKKFGAFAAQPDRREWANIIPWKVCRYVMAVDAESNDGRRVRIDQMYANTAETCYFLHTGAAGHTMVSRLDNDFSNSGPFYGTFRTSQTDRFKWSNFVVGSGYKAINKADDFLKEYVRKRFRYDVLGTGLIGPELRQVWANQEDLMAAVKDFAEEYIFKHLIDIDEPGHSEEVSLYKHFKEVFDKALPVPDQINRETADLFALKCRQTVAERERTFYISKKLYTESIRNSVLKGIEKNIGEYGLLYTYELLAWVDDDYCERAVLDKLMEHRKRLNLWELEKDIYETKTSIFQQLFGTPQVDLLEKLRLYKDACFLSFVTDGIISIIRDITQDRIGLLEYLRRGDSSHFGIKGMIDFVQEQYHRSLMNCRDLATKFHKSVNDVCNDYFPRVHEFVEQDETWKNGNLFEHLYGSIVPLDASHGGKDNAGFAHQPIRSGMTQILESIKGQTATNRREFRFADVVLSRPEDAPSQLKELMVGMDRFVEEVFESNLYPVKAWLDEPLELIFDECFIKDGVLDGVALQDYVNSFRYSIPMFYPVAQGTWTQAATRLLCVGNSDAFAQRMGYIPGDCNAQFLPDTGMDHRLVVIKYEVGHNFYDYKYFDMLSSVYEHQRGQIVRGAIGCHIHKEFVYRDIAKAFDHCKAKRFKDFISLCWYDSFFEYLNSLQDKSCIEAFFWGQIGMPAMPPIPLDAESSDLSPVPLPPSFGGFNTTSHFDFGYKPIVRMLGLGELRLHAERIDIVEGRIVFVRSEWWETNVKSQSLYSVFSDVIQIDDLDWSRDYLCKIREQFQNMSSDMKAEIQKEFYQASLLQEDGDGLYTGEIWNRFSKKLDPMLARFKKTSADEKVLYIIKSVVGGMSGKNLFSF